MSKKPDAPVENLPTLLNAQSALTLLQSVDGPSLASYSSKESVYVGRQVPVAAGSDLQVPIHVANPGSIVEYSIEIAHYDISVEIRADREEGKTVVKEKTRIAAEQSPLVQKFLVGSVPCQLVFIFDNSFSWLREKAVSYKITVTPPSLEALQAGRRRRAQACLQAVSQDRVSCEHRLEEASSNKQALQRDVAQLMQELAEKKKAWQVAEKEEAWLQERQALRVEQEKLLKERLQNGWSDEEEDNVEEEE